MAAEGKSAITLLKMPVRLDFTVTPGRATSRFLNGLAEGRIVGQRCPNCGMVYVPPRGACPPCGVPTEVEVPVADTGTVTTFCVVNIPYEAATVPVPFVLASVLLDGSDNTMYHLVLDVPPSEVRMGMRVRAVWVEREKLAPTMESIRYFKPTGEPDAPRETYARHV